MSSAGGTESPAWIKAEGVPCGSYNIVILIRDANNISLYESVQTVTVLNGLETNTWTLESGEGAITQDGDSVTFNVGGDLIKSKTADWIYVGVPAGLKDQGVTASPTNKGGAYSPLDSLDSAFKKIISTQIADKDYQILVSGEVSGEATIPEGIISGVGGNAKSITIAGLAGSASDSLKGSGTASVLTINTAVPVTLKNIKITGGGGSLGGGICANAGSKLTIESGTLVTGNSAENGGGVAASGTVVMKGGEIKANTATVSGGGLYVDEGSAVTLTGGTISENSAPKADESGGGAIFAKDGFTIGGSAKIPYGVSGTKDAGKNDVFVCMGASASYKTIQIASGGFSYAANEDAPAAVLTPQGWWRNYEILKSPGGDVIAYSSYFKMTDTDFYFGRTAGHNDIAKLKAALCVSFERGSTAPGTSGTRSNPYKNLSQALMALSGGDPDTIIVDGYIAAGTIPDTFTTDYCSALTISGANGPNADGTPQDSIDAGGANKSALTMNTAVPVTIKNLKITGGQGTTESSSSYGGGIYLQSGTLCLADGALVTGNKASNGGGVYVGSGASLYMYGTALIGDSADTQATGDEVTGTTWTNCANYASMDGGGIYNKGSVYLGYSGTVGGNLMPASFTGGVKRNLSHLTSGGISSYGTGTASDERSVLKMRAGYVSFNKACNAGGGIKAFRSNVEIADGEISHNKGKEGGGISIAADSDVAFSGGTIKENTATASESYYGGGAVYVMSESTASFTMSGSASIPYGGAKNNNDLLLGCATDTYGNIVRNASLKIASALTASGTAATITLGKWQRGLQFLGVGGTYSALSEGDLGKFDFTDLGWEKERYKVSADNDAARINAPIYVASETASQRAYTHAAPSDDDGTNGNSYHPFKTIEKACSVMDDPTQTYTIQIDGEIKGCQVLPATLLKTKSDSDPAGSNYAFKVKLQSASDEPKDTETTTHGVINANLESAIDNGSALTVNTQSLVFIERLTFTGGKTNGNGGGIFAGENVSVDLGKNTKIRGNYAAGGGGGIYVTGGSATYAVVCAHGNVEIGNKNFPAASVGSEDLSKGGNVAAYGAGVYSGGFFSLGSYLTGSKTYASGVYSTEAWICGNTATGTDSDGGGGGVYVSGVKGSLDLKNYGESKYHINYNYSAAKGGGGLYLADSNNGSVADTIDESINLEIIGNKTLGNGGGIFFGRTKSLTLPKNCLIESNEAAKGGGIYNASTNGSLSFTKSGGTIKLAKNKAAKGGGIYCTGNSNTILQYGTIGGSGTDAAIEDGKNTATEAGGAVYVEYYTASSNNFTVKGNAEIPPAYTDGSCVNNNDVYLAWYASSTATPKPTARIYIDETSTLTKTTVAAITPQGWQRGSEVLKASSEMTETIANRFKMSQDDADWEKKPASGTTPTTAYIMMPVYVASSATNDDTRKHCQKAPSTDRAGTPSAPYAEISEAIAEAVANGADIIVDGTVTGAQTIGSAATSNLAIRGYIKTGESSSAAVLNGNSAGSTLTVNASGKYVTITNLAITGGSAENGGGVNIASGTVKLGGGAKIYGNKATANGGGVYLAGSDSTLFMFGTAIIGEDKNGYPNDADHASNSAENGGGIYNNGGNLYLGYTGMSGANPVPASDEFTGGVRRNYAKSYGGIQCEKGINKIRDGNISNNAAQQKGGALGFTNTGGTYSIMGGTFATNYAPSGGAIYVPDATSLVSVTISAGTFDSNVANNGGALWLSSKGKVTVSGSTLFKGNTAGIKGGAVYNEGVFEMTGGTIGGSGIQNKATTTTALGGAIYQGGTFYVSGKAVVYAGSERVNDVYLAAASTDVKQISINAEYKGNGNTTTNKMSVTPAVWKRGMAILGGSKLTDGDTGNCNYFAVTDSDWSVLSDSTNKGKIDADIIVAANSSTSYDATKARGTSSDPYKTIADALANGVDTSHTTIKVKGTIAKQSISSWPTTGAAASVSDITLAGYMASDATSSDATINANSNGSALTVDASEKTVTIQNIKITKGSGTSMTVGAETQFNGGGICLKAGTVKLGNGVVIAGNTVTGNGGGVYVASGASLFMYGTALIGDTSDYTASSATVNLSPTSSNVGCANSAKNGGGIFNQNGNVYIGCDSSGNSTGTSASYALTTGYGVRRNYANTLGGGVYHNIGTIKFGSGCVSYNHAVQGGAIYNSSGNVVTISGALALKNNEATNSGGAIYNAGTLTMSAGSFSGNKATGTSGKGGAIYQGGTFNISGSATIMPGSLKTNDVYLVANGTTAVKQITISDTYNGSGNTKTNKMSVTPAVWKRGMPILGGTSLTYGSTGNSNYFAITDTDWKVLTSSANNGKLDADIYVAGTGYDSTSGVGAGSDTNPGTKSKPFASIKVAAEACWSTSEAFTIYISGMISGSTQTIPAENATAGTTLASKITLQGSSNTTDGIDRGLASSSAVSDGSALIINYQGYVDITNLKIMGGNTTGNGGGIKINGPSTFSTSTCPRVNLKAGTLVQQNKAKNGGGVYSSNSILCLYGTATIGNDGASDRSASNTALTTGINIATTAGGGIYSTGGRLYLGGAWISGAINSTDTYKLTKGVYANVCTVPSGTTAGAKNCGGIYNDSTAYFYSGNVNLNYGAYTGGIYSTGSNAQFYMSGGTIHNNRGTGFYNNTDASFWMYGSACIGDSSASTVATNLTNLTDCSNTNSGLINKGTARLGYSAGTTKSKLSGGIYRNYRQDNYKPGGGIVNDGGTLYFDSGTIAFNKSFTAGSAGGGGIYSNSTVYMTGSSSTQYACITNNKASRSTDDGYGGGICMDGTSAKLLMSGYAVIGKSGQTTPPANSTADGANKAARGGGIYAYDGAYVCLGYSSFTSGSVNTKSSLDNGGVYYNYASENGGGIYCGGTSTNYVYLYVASGKINANKAYNTSQSYGNGGGIWANIYSEIYMGGGQISKNSASTYGGGVYLCGTMFMYGSALIGDTNTGTTTTTESNYSNCAKAGGGVYVTSTSGTLALGYDSRVGTDYYEENLTGGIKHNFATGTVSGTSGSSGYTGVGTTNPAGVGGGVYMDGNLFYMNTGTIGYNKAYDGAGLCITHNPSATMYGGSITYNSARRNGGGVYVYEKSPFTVKGSITYNTADADGGGVYLEEGYSDEYGTTLELEGSSAAISNNTATNGNGGGVCSSDGSDFCIRGGATMAGNYAGGNGGAVYGTKVNLQGVANIPGTSGNIGKTKYNDIYSGYITAIWLTSSNLPAGTGFSNMYITLPSGLSASDISSHKVVEYSWTYPEPEIASYGKFMLTQSSPYYSSKKIGPKGYLVAQ